jgi:hypothetical protein
VLEHDHIGASEEVLFDGDVNVEVRILRVEIAEGDALHLPNGVGEHPVGPGGVQFGVGKQDEDRSGHGAYRWPAALQVAGQAVY